MRRAAAFMIILGVGLLAACVPANTGVDGVVNVGPICPPGTTNASCPQEAGPVTINVSNDKGDPVTSAVADSQGNFKIPLPPGTYIVQPTRGNGEGPGKSGPPVIITVQQGRFTLVKLSMYH